MKNTKVHICDDCLKSISYSKKYCQKCGDRIENEFGLSICPSCREKQRHYERVFVPLIYKGQVRKSILNFKFHDKRSYAQTYAILIFTELKACGFIPDAITFVPLHWKRYLKRGYNQTKLVAENLAKLLNIPCIRLLKKKFYTPKLSTLSFAQRLKTVKDSFKATKYGNDLTNKKILLVDDIITTSATAEECSKILVEKFNCKPYICAIASSERHKK